MTHLALLSNTCMAAVLLLNLLFLFESVNRLLSQTTQFNESFVPFIDLSSLH